MISTPPQVHEYDTYIEQHYARFRRKVKMETSVVFTFSDFMQPRHRIALQALVTNVSRGFISCPLRIACMTSIPAIVPFKGRVLRRAKAAKNTGRAWQDRFPRGKLGYCDTYQGAGGSRCLARRAVYRMDGGRDQALATLE